MFDGIYDDSEGMNRERVEMMVEIYEGADCVRDHDFRTNTQPLQHTGNHILIFDKTSLFAHVQPANVIPAVHRKRPCEDQGAGCINF